MAQAVYRPVAFRLITGHATGMAATSKKIAVYLDLELLRAVRDEAARSGRSEHEIVEEAVRRYLAPRDAEQGRRELRAFLDGLPEQPASDEQALLDAAYDELHAIRRERRSPSR